MTPLERYARFWEELAPERLPALAALLAPAVRFKDPFNDVRGIDATIAVMRAMYDHGAPRFEIVDRAVGEAGTGYLRWRCVIAPARSADRPRRHQRDPLRCGRLGRRARRPLGRRGAALRAPAGAGGSHQAGEATDERVRSGACSGRPESRDHPILLSVEREYRHLCQDGRTVVRGGFQMKWMLVVLVLGNSPVRTDLIFDNLDACLRAEDAMRAEYARAYNTWLQWARQNPSVAGYPQSEAFMRGRIGVNNRGTCIPHEGLQRAD